MEIGNEKIHNNNLIIDDHRSINNNNNNSISTFIRLDDVEHFENDDEEVFSGFKKVFSFNFLV